MSMARHEGWLGGRTMTPNEHDNPEASEEQPTTELRPFAPGTAGGLDDTMPDLPVMEPLPDSHALPDPGYPEMPTSAREQPDDPPPPGPPPASPGPPAASPGPLAPPWPARGPADGPSARSWPRPP